jgi:hypothetical protein
MPRLHRALVLTSLLVASRAFAQPQPQPPQQQPADPSKMDAKALMTTGVRLLEAKDYLGALALFREAYVRFPSAKILLNIGTTLKLLDRKAEAANTYQHYLDSQDADPNRAKQVIGELAELDKSVGVVEVIVRPADAEVSFGDEWIPAARAKQWRVPPGAIKIGARKQGYLNAEQTSTVAAGAKTSITVALAEVPKQPVSTISDDLIAQVEPEKPRSRIGAIAMLHVSVVPKLGSAALVGATVDLTPQLGIDAAVLLGPGLVSDGMATRPPPSFGGYLGGNFAFLPGAFRPRAGAGMTIFSSDGARLQVRAAAGLEWVATRNISLLVEVGAEVALNPEDDIRELAIVPALAVAGRL